jgi:hypothetical protein
VRPVRFASTGYEAALADKEVVFAGVVVFPEARVGDRPHVKEIEASGFPLPVK